MRRPAPFLRPWLFGRDASGGRRLFYASDLILVFIVLAALLDIGFQLLG